MLCTVQKPYLLILANLQSNKRHKKETLRFYYQFFACMHLSKREIFHSYEKSRKFFIFSSFLDQSSCMKSLKCRFIWSSDRPEPELRDRCSWEKLVTVADFRRYPRQKYGSTQSFLWWFWFLRWKPRKTGGLVYVPPEKTKTETTLSFWVLG